MVKEIAAAVDALSRLFNELLDLGRLDAKGIQVHRRPFVVGELFVRLRLHFGPQAFDRGLALRFRGAHHWADADPILVERVLRNLLSNALRYTQDGTVLVGCRRRGNRLQLEVCDSGPGSHQNTSNASSRSSIRSPTPSWKPGRKRAWGRPTAGTATRTALAVATASGWPSCDG